MAEDHDNSAGDRPAPKGAADKPLAGKASSSELLPTIESPPLSPADDASGARQHASVVLDTEALSRRWTGSVFNLRHRRHAMLGAWGAAAVALGVVVGMAMGAVMVAPTNSAPVRLADGEALHQSIDALNKDIISLKARLAAAENMAALVVKTTERVTDAADITGSIPAAPAIDAPPLPAPRPALLASRAPLVHDWSIHSVRSGIVYVQGHGAVYQVQLGAPLPGLGPVQDVARRNGRWAVLTPKGLIVSPRERQHFERF